MAERSGAEASLKRLGGGRWQTRDERFTIEPQSGTWVVVDAEQTDELGLPLVRGPFPSLTAAKAAIDTARAAGPMTSPLPGPVESETAPSESAPPGPREAAPAAGPRREPSPRPTRQARPKPQPSREASEPRWLAALEPDERRHARRVLRALEATGAEDAENVVRRDVEGRLPAVAAWAIARALVELGPDPSVRAVLDLLSDGRDRDLEVRWRLVDGEGRPITVEERDLRAARRR